MERTRLSDSAFLGDVLAVISMCAAALDSENPLPQITPCPLVSRFRMGKVRGVDIPTDVSEELPSLVTMEGKRSRQRVKLISVLESEKYMRYALGITTTFSILARLDRTMIICKTYVQITETC